QRDSPTDEVLDDLREVTELAPTAPQKHPADRDAGEQWGEPGEVSGDALWPRNQPSDKELHASCVAAATHAAGYSWPWRMARARSCASAHSLRLISRKPLPLQEFCPLQALLALLQ